MANGPIPDGLFVLHHCDNPPCVKTESDESYPNGHLFLGSHSDNMVDASRKGRHPRARLTADDVREVRAELARGATQVDLGLRFGVSNDAISRIARGETWRWLDA